MTEYKNIGTDHRDVCGRDMHFDGDHGRQAAAQGDAECSALHSEALDWWRMKLEKKLIEEKMRLLAQKIAARAEFREGCNTAQLPDDELVIRVERREAVKWDQAKLRNARRILGDELFERLFRAEWKHASRARMNDFLEFQEEPLTAPIRDAMQICVTENVNIEPRTR